MRKDFLLFLSFLKKSKTARERRGNNENAVIYI